MASKWPIPNLENATPTFLLDEIGRMRVESSRLKFLDGVYKAALLARITKDQQEGNAPIRGERFQGQYKTVTSERIDSEAVRTLLADRPDELRQVIKVTSYQQLDTSPLEYPSTSGSGSGSGSGGPNGQ